MKILRKGLLIEATALFLFGIAAGDEKAFECTQSLIELLAIIEKRRELIRIGFEATRYLSSECGISLSHRHVTIVVVPKRRIDVSNEPYRGRLVFVLGARSPEQEIRS